jgi:hypothetical protein
LVEDAEQDDEPAEEYYGNQEPPEEDEQLESSKKRNIQDEKKDNENKKVTKINHGSLMDKLSRPAHQTSINESYQSKTITYQSNTSINQSNPSIPSPRISPSNSQSSKRTCKCQLPAVSRIVSKEGVNKGKEFFVCSKGESEGKCRFFEWADDKTVNNTKQPIVSPRISPSNSQSSERTCKCQLPAVSRIVAKEGVNKGKEFFVCSKGMSDKCSFFEWADDKTVSNTNMNSNNNYKSYNNKGTSGGNSYTNSSTVTCFKCKQTGHWANKCPNR